MISNKLKEIVEQRKATIVKDIEFYNLLKKRSAPNQRKFLSSAIKEADGVSIISEIKPASPTLGIIKSNVNVKEISKEMENSGVIGLSILTESNYFNGSYENLQSALNNTSLPCLMKDFVIDKIQISIASHIGAKNILLINSVLRENLNKFVDIALRHGIEPFIEIHNIEEIDELSRLNEIGYTPSLIGVNNRDLKTMEINLDISKKIIPKIKEELGADIIVVSESGINTLGDIKSLTPYGADAFLIGSSIMQSINIKEKILELRGIE